jgi:hypothetical protein
LGSVLGQERLGDLRNSCSAPLSISVRSITSW